MGCDDVPSLSPPAYYHLTAEQRAKSEEGKSKERRAKGEALKAES
jgi:hypothetical protein